MHSFTLSILLNHTIALPFIVSLVRFRKIHPSFYPFAFLIWLGFLSESISLVYIYSSGNNTVIGNLYVLLECVILLVQFYRWKTIAGSHALLLGGILASIWLFDNVLVNQVTVDNALFRTVSSLTYVFLSLMQINRSFIFGRGPILRNPRFLACFSFLLFFGWKAYVESFNALHLGLSERVLLNMYVTLYFINAVTNCLYALTLLCIRPRQEYILLY